MLPADSTSEKGCFSSFQDRVNGLDKEQGIIITALFISIVSLIVGIVAYRASTYFLPYSLSFLDSLIRVGRLGSIIWITNSTFSIVSLTALLAIRSCCRDDRSIDPDLKKLLLIDVTTEEGVEGKKSLKQASEVTGFLLNAVRKLTPEQMIEALDDPSEGKSVAPYLSPECIQQLNKEVFVQHVENIFPVKESIPHYLSDNWEVLSPDRVIHIIDKHPEIAEKYLPYTSNATLVQIPLNTLKSIDMNPILSKNNRANGLRSDHVLMYLQTGKLGNWTNHINLHFFQTLNVENIHSLTLAAIEQILRLPNERKHVLVSRVAALKNDVVQAIIDKIIGKINEGENEQIPYLGVWLEHLTKKQISSLSEKQLTSHILNKIFVKPGQETSEKFSGLDVQMIKLLIIEGRKFDWGDYVSIEHFQCLFEKDLWPFMGLDQEEVIRRVRQLFPFHRSEVFFPQLVVGGCCINKIIASGYAGLSLQKLSTEHIKNLTSDSFATDIENLDILLNALFPTNQDSTPFRFASLTPKIINTFIKNKYTGEHLGFCSKEHIERLNVKEVTSEQLAQILSTKEKVNSLSTIQKEALTKDKKLTPTMLEWIEPEKANADKKFKKRKKKVNSSSKSMVETSSTK